MADDKKNIWNPVRSVEELADALNLDKSGLWIPAMDDTPRDHGDPNPYTAVTSNQKPFDQAAMQQALDAIQQMPPVPHPIRVVYHDPGQDMGTVHAIVTDNPDEMAPADVERLRAALDAMAAKGQKPVLVVRAGAAYLMPEPESVFDRIAKSFGIPAKMFDTVDANYSSHRETMRGYEAGLQDLKDRTIRRIGAGLAKFFPNIEPPRHLNCRCHCMMIMTSRHQRPLRLRSTHPRRYRGPKL